jgi:hypothetical protein
LDGVERLTTDNLELMREGDLSEQRVENSEEKGALKWEGTLKIRQNKYSSRLRMVHFYISGIFVHKVFFTIIIIDLILVKISLTASVV